MFFLNCVAHLLPNVLADNQSSDLSLESARAVFHCKSVDAQPKYMFEHKRVNLKLKSSSLRSRCPLTPNILLPHPSPAWLGRTMRWRIADEANGSCPYRTEMQALTILFKKRQLKPLGLQLDISFFCLVEREKAGERSC